MEHIDSWKNKTVFEKQLALNLEELSGQYPEHWNAFISLIFSILGITEIIDVGCGCGAYSELCRRHVPWLKYIGIDYAQEAIDVATKQWPEASFICKNYLDLKKEDIKITTVLHACSLHNVLPNGDECMEFLLNLQAPYVLLGKIHTTLGESSYTIYRAYGEIQTYLYQHNRSHLQDLFNKYNYTAREIRNSSNSNFLLTKKL